MQIISVFTGIKNRGQHSSDVQRTLHLRYLKFHGGGGGGKKIPPPNLQKLSHYTNMACFISCFAKTIPSYSRDVDSSLQPRSLKFNGGRGGGGKIAPSYFTMIECSLYKENTPYYLFQKKKIILQQHSSRGAKGKLHLRFLINV